MQRPPDAEEIDGRASDDDLANQQGAGVVVPPRALDVFGAASAKPAWLAHPGHQRAYLMPRVIVQRPPDPPDSG